MRKASLLPVGTCLALFCFANCAADRGSTGQGSGGTNESGGSSAGGSNGGSGGTSSSGGTTSAGGSAAGGSGGSKATGGTSSSGGLSAGGTSAGGSATGGATASGGSGGSGGSMATGGTTATGGSANGGAGGGGVGGTTATGGTTSTGGTTAPRTDCLGKALAKPGDFATQSRAYLNLGDMRLINNRWGADARNCGGATYKVFVGTDRVIGYDFNRPTCGGERAYPDYPEVEFGVAPFGSSSPDLTSPACSSTTLLPAQIKTITSATLNIDGFNSTYQNPGYYDTNFEFWISQRNPLEPGDPGVYAEVIVFLGWHASRMEKNVGWPCDKSGSVTAGSNTYRLCHQSDEWSNGRWRFFNFNLEPGGPTANYTGKVDVKKMLDWVMQNYANSSRGNFSGDMWLTRIEVGTEVDDNTQGTAKIKNLTFEINGTSKSIEIGQ
jgi:hypothetical protein